MNDNYVKYEDLSKKEIIIFDATRTDKKEILRRITNGLKKDDRSITLCDLGDIIKRYIYMRNVMPRVHPFYAVKCNNETTVLKTLEILGSGFDCASSKEVNDLIELQTNPDRIIFANPAKPKQCIKNLAALNVELMTFDCEEELIKVEQLFKEAKLVIRIRSNAKKAAYDFGKKFGCDAISDAPILLQKAKELQLNVVGVSFHVGSLCEEFEAYSRAIACCRTVFDIGLKLGFHMSLLDIGGGFHGLHSETIDSSAKIINDSLEKYFPDQTVTIISEPGRYLVESSLWVAGNIHTKKISYNYQKQEKNMMTNGKFAINISNIDFYEAEDGLNNDIVKDSNMRMYYMNDGICGTFNVTIYEKLRARPEPLEKIRSNKLYNSIIWGPTCYSDDKIPYIFKLPDLKIGDWILFQQMGAYSLPLVSDFNSIPRTKIIYVIEKELAPLLMNNDQFFDYNFTEF